MGFRKNRTHIKGVKSKEVKLLPALYSRRSDKMHHMVFEFLSSAGRVILLYGPRATFSLDQGCRNMKIVISA